MAIIGRDGRNSGEKKKRRGLDCFFQQLSSDLASERIDSEIRFEKLDGSKRAIARFAKDAEDRSMDDKLVTAFSEFSKEPAVEEDLQSFPLGSNAPLTLISLLTTL